MQWVDFPLATRVLPPVSGAFGPYIYTNSDLTSPVTVYLRRYAVERLEGAHAIQTVSFARPTNRTNGALRWVEHDLVDDGLLATMPNLGSNATVAWGDQIDVKIQTGQTISGTVTLPQRAKLFGAIFIDRPLTPLEEARVARYFSMKGAGA